MKYIKNAKQFSHVESIAFHSCSDINIEDRKCYEGPTFTIGETHTHHRVNLLYSIEY